MADVLANLIVVLVVLWSSVVVLRKLMPKSMNRLQQALSQRAVQMGWLRMSRWLTPKASSSSCGGCSSCGDDADHGCSTPVVSQEKQEQPVKWR